MQKYHIIKNGEQSGPFTREELKSQAISKDTMVWYEGLSEWVKADAIAEIKATLFSAPPPYTPTPPVYKEVHVTAQQSIQKSNNIWKAARVVVIIIVLIFGMMVLLNVVNNPRHNSYINVDVNPPNPRIVETHAAEDPSSKIFAYREAIYTTVINQGGNGKILVTAQLIQGGNVYNRTEEVYLNANQSQEVHFVFTEARALGGNMQYSATARAL